MDSMFAHNAPKMHTAAGRRFAQQFAALVAFADSVSTVSEIVLAYPDAYNGINEDEVDSILHWSESSWYKNEAAYKLSQDVGAKYDYYLDLRDIYKNHAIGYAWDGGEYNTQLLPIQLAQSSADDLDVEEDVTALMEFGKYALNRDDLFQMADTYFWRISRRNQAFPYRQFSKAATKDVLNEYARSSAVNLIRNPEDILREMLVSRMVDNLITYLAELSALVLRKTSSLEVFPDEKIEVSILADSLQQADSLDKGNRMLIEPGAQKKIDDMSRASWSKVVDWFESKLDFQLFSDLDTHLKVAHLIAQRNSIIHHRGHMKMATVTYLLKSAEKIGGKYRKGKDEKQVNKVNEQMATFNQQMATRYLNTPDEDLRLTYTEVKEATVLLLNAVADIDMRAVNKFRLDDVTVHQDK